MRECTYFACEGLVSPLKSSVTTAPDKKENRLVFFENPPGLVCFQSVSGLFGGFAIGSIYYRRPPHTVRRAGRTTGAVEKKLPAAIKNADNRARDIHEHRKMLVSAERTTMLMRLESMGMPC